MTMPATRPAAAIDEGRIRVPCPRCTLPIALTLPPVIFPGDDVRALTSVSAALTLHVRYGCPYS